MPSGALVCMCIYPVDIKRFETLCRGGPFRVVMMVTRRSALSLRSNRDSFFQLVVAVPCLEGLGLRLRILLAEQMCIGGKHGQTCI